MKRLAVLFAAALLTMALSGIVHAEEAAPVEKKDTPAAEAKPAKKMIKKKDKKCPEGAAEMKKDGAAPAAKPAKKKKKEAAGC